MDITAECSDRLLLPEFPRSNGYDPAWVIAGDMGPNPLWLLEDLAADLRLEPGMRVLDLGCGRARTSVFLAREYGVTVWAADLWISPTENLRHVTEAGVAGAVYPIRVEAHDLPFADGYFDAVISVDAYQYFGTDDLYIGYLRRFVRRGGQIAIAVPALTEELGEVPEHLRPFWEWDFACFHTVHWWRRHWARTGLVEVTAARAQADGWRYWRLWSEVCAEASGSGPVGGPVTGSADADSIDAGPVDVDSGGFVRGDAWRAVDMLAADQGRTFTFALVVGQVG